jgi:hypothetical protein
MVKTRSRSEAGPKTSRPENAIKRIGTSCPRSRALSAAVVLRPPHPVWQPRALGRRVRSRMPPRRKLQPWPLQHLRSGACGPWNGKRHGQSGQPGKYQNGAAGWACPDGHRLHSDYPKRRPVFASTPSEIVGGYAGDLPDRARADQIGRQLPSQRHRPIAPPCRLDLSKMLFRAQGKLHHPFEQLVRRQASKIVHDQLLGVHEVPKLQRLAA